MAKRIDIKPSPNLLLLDDETEKGLCSNIREFSGQLDVLESALGALVMGQHFGTRVLFMVHSRTTINKYEKILGVKYADHCPERGPLAEKSIGLNVADKLNSYWKVATGKTKVKGKSHAE